MIERMASPGSSPLSERVLAVGENPDEDLLDGETEVEVRGLHDLDRSCLSIAVIADGAVGIRKHGERD